MDATKQRRLEEAGWSVGSTRDFLDLSEEEAIFVELKLALSESLKRQRTERGMTQTSLAKRMGSSQSRVAKMEASDPSVSLDLLVRALLAVGATRQEIAATLSRGSEDQAA